MKKQLSRGRGDSPSGVNNIGWRKFTLLWEQSEKFATVFMAFLGLLAFGWQVVEQTGAKTERIVIETGEPTITPQGTIRLPLHVMNHSERSVYVRDVGLSMSSQSPINFAPDSVVKLESGDKHTYDSTVPVTFALSASQSSELVIQIRTTRKRHDYPARYIFSVATMNTIAQAAGVRPPTLSLDSSTALALRNRIAEECNAKLVGGLWRDRNGDLWVGGAVQPGQAAAVFCLKD
jgi:hypothetical protein